MSGAGRDPRHPVENGVDDIVPASDSRIYPGTDLPDGGLAVFLKENLKFGTLLEGEASLRAIHSMWEDLVKKGVRDGAYRCRQRVLEGKKRLRFMSHDRRLGPSKREEKAEIHTWFSLWLEDPASFFQWLELRQSTSQFKLLLERLASAPEGGQKGSPPQRR